MDFYFNYYFKEGHCIPAFVSGVLLSLESRTYFDRCVCLVGSWHGDMDALHSSKSSPSALECWFAGDSARGWLYQQTLKAVMALWLVQCPLLSPSSLTSAELPHPPWESGSSTPTHAAMGQGSDRLEKLDFSSSRSGLLPAWCMPFMSQ